jgi:hypothetical protein
LPVLSASRWSAAFFLCHGAIFGSCI